MSKKRRIGKKIANAKSAAGAGAGAGASQTKSDLEILKTPPKNRTEAKKHLAIRLRLLRTGALNSKSMQVLASKAQQEISIANSLRFAEGIVDSVATDRVSESNKRWRGRTAD